MGDVFSELPVQFNETLHRLGLQEVILRPAHAVQGGLSFPPSDPSYSELFESHIL